MTLESRTQTCQKEHFPEQYNAWMGETGCRTQMVIILYPKDVSINFLVVSSNMFFLYEEIQM